MSVTALTKTRLISGVLLEAWRRLSGQPLPEMKLNVQSVQP
ncbi:MAG: hypothetical protein R2856_23590 [Caldilineaceae bacterium]